MTTTHPSPHGPPPAAPLLALALVVVAGCSSHAPEEPAPGPRPSAPGANVILVSVDTLRADRLGCYGYDRPTSPALDALAARGVRFARVVAESSWTLPSHVSLFTGLHPRSHGVTLPSVLGPDVATLTEVLRAAGYRTFGDAAAGFMRSEFGFARGFDVYDDREKPLAETLEAARRHVEACAPGDKYFLFLHTYDVHCPYDPPEEYVQQFQRQPPADHLEVEGKCGNPYFNSLDLTQGQTAFLSDQYDAGIRAADDQLGEFVEWLEERGELEDTVLIVVSDHGEELMEHGQVGHERTLHWECLSVPWILVAPGVGPSVVEAGAGLVDVMPTLLELLDLPSPSAVQGRSLLPLVAGERADWSDRPLFSELDRHVVLRSVFQEPHHLIVDRTAKRRSLFDVATDPLEQDDLDRRSPGLGVLLERRIEEHERELGPRGEPIPIALSAEQRERLQALGYTE